MEIKLHHHALPVIMVVTALFVLSFFALSRASTSFTSLTQALVNPVFQAEPQKNGLVKISPAEPQTNSATQAGSRAQLLFNFQ